MMNLKAKISLIILSIMLLAGIIFSPAHAQVGSAYDLIAEVNALRQSKGLSPYEIENFLMNFAQDQSNYMASLGYWTHTRSDGSTAWQYGIEENVAMGMNMSVSYCVYTVWSDTIHWKTMVEHATGSVGAGVAFSGDNVFYTLNVRPGEAVSENPEPPPHPISRLLAQEEESPDVYVSDVVTSTPNADGSIIHYVKYGESLWSIAIAYGTTGAEIMANSGNNPSVTDVYEGQMLIIRNATPNTPTISPTPTQIPPTRTNTPPRPTRTPLPTETPGPTPTYTIDPPFIYRTFSNTRSVALTLIVGSAVGLVLLLIFAFVKKK